MNNDEMNTGTDWKRGKSRFFFLAGRVDFGGASLFFFRAFFRGVCSVNNSRKAVWASQHPVCRSVSSPQPPPAWACVTMATTQLRTSCGVSRALFVVCFTLPGLAMPSFYLTVGVPGSSFFSFSLIDFILFPGILSPSLHQQGMSLPSPPLSLSPLLCLCKHIGPPFDLIQVYPLF